jgi:hypothetical protein
MKRLLERVIRSLIHENTQQSYAAFYAWLETVLPKLIHKYMLRGQSMKVCSTISPEFAVIAQNAGFTVGTMSRPGHEVNVVTTSDGAFLVDLSHIQFLCKHDLSDKSSRAEVIQSYKRLRRDPWLAVKIEALDEMPTNVKYPDGSMIFDPVRAFNDYDPDESEQDNKFWFDKIR